MKQPKKIKEISDLDGADLYEAYRKSFHLGMRPNGESVPKLSDLAMEERLAWQAAATEAAKLAANSKEVSDLQVLVDQQYKDIDDLEKMLRDQKERVR